jgi:7-cyano-7-deazaguanine synthase
MNDDAVLLLSGGLDSGVALALWQERGARVRLALTADYGQRAAAIECEYAAALARRFGVPWQRLPLDWLGGLARRSGSALAGVGPLPQGTLAAPGDAASAARVWIPARNVLLLACAAAFAETLGAGVVLAGFNREEAATFADNSAGFAAAMTEALAFGTRNRVRVESPTLDLDKAAIAGAAKRLGLGQDDFWSCYEAGPERCGVCESCLRSRRAFG